MASQTWNLNGVSFQADHNGNYSMSGQVPSAGSSNVISELKFPSVTKNARVEGVSIGDFGGPVELRLSGSFVLGERFFSEAFERFGELSLSINGARFSCLSSTAIGVNQVNPSEAASGNLSPYEYNRFMAFVEAAVPTLAGQTSMTIINQTGTITLSDSTDLILRGQEIATVSCELRDVVTSTQENSWTWSGRSKITSDIIPPRMFDPSVSTFNMSNGPIIFRVRFAPRFGTLELADVLWTSATGNVGLGTFCPRHIDVGGVRFSYGDSSFYVPRSNQESAVDGLEDFLNGITDSTVVAMTMYEALPDTPSGRIVNPILSGLPEHGTHNYTAEDTNGAVDWVVKKGTGTAGPGPFSTTIYSAGSRDRDTTEEVSLLVHGVEVDSDTFTAYNMEIANPIETLEADRAYRFEARGVGLDYQLFWSRGTSNPTEFGDIDGDGVYTSRAIPADTPSHALRMTITIHVTIPARFISNIFADSFTFQLIPVTGVRIGRKIDTVPESTTWNFTVLNSSSTPTWRINSGVGSINGSGQYSAPDVDDPATVEVGLVIGGVEEDTHTFTVEPNLTVETQEFAYGLGPPGTAEGVILPLPTSTAEELPPGSWESVNPGATPGRAVTRIVRTVLRTLEGTFISASSWSYNPPLGQQPWIQALAVSGTISNKIESIVAGESHSFEAADLQPPDGGISWNLIGQGTRVYGRYTAPDEVFSETTATMQLLLSGSVVDSNTFTVSITPHIVGKLRLQEPSTWPEDTPLPYRVLGVSDTDTIEWSVTSGGGSFDANYQTATSVYTPPDVSVNTVIRIAVSVNGVEVDFDTWTVTPVAASAVRGKIDNPINGSLTVGEIHQYTYSGIFPADGVVTFVPHPSMQLGSNLISITPAGLVSVLPTLTTNQHAVIELHVNGFRADNDGFTVLPAPTRGTISNPITRLQTGADYLFLSSGIMPEGGTVTWQVSGGGSIGATGFYQSPNSVSQTLNVTVSLLVNGIVVDTAEFIVGSSTSQNIVSARITRPSTVDPNQMVAASVIAELLSFDARSDEETVTRGVVATAIGRSIADDSAEAITYDVFESEMNAEIRAARVASLTKVGLVITWTRPPGTAPWVYVLDYKEAADEDWERYTETSALTVTMDTPSVEVRVTPYLNNLGFGTPRTAS